MKTKNNKWLEDVNKQLNELLGDTLQPHGSDNRSTPERN